MSTPPPEQGLLGPTGLPASAPEPVAAVVEEQQAATAVLTGATLAAVLAAWAELDVTAPFDSFYGGLGTQLFVQVSMAQEAAAGQARDYVRAATLQQGDVVLTPRIDPLPFAGRASDGRGLDTLLLGPVIRTAQASARGDSRDLALAHGEELLRRIVQVQVTDAFREATGVVITGSENLDIDWPALADDFDALEREVYRRVEDALAAEEILVELEQIINAAAGRDVVQEAERYTRRAARRPADFEPRASRSPIGWIRVLTPPSCGRCAVLAGKWYGWNDGFARHDNCDCIHVPCTLVGSKPMLVNAAAYFDALTDGLQDELFGKAQAQAIRDGADIEEVVNATSRRGGMYYADGRQFTTEGTTRRGRFRRQTAAGRARQGRLTPLQIYREATSQDEAVQLLKDYGYIID